MGFLIMRQAPSRWTEVAHAGQQSSKINVLRVGRAPSLVTLLGGFEPMELRMIKHPQLKFGVTLPPLLIERMYVPMQPTLGPTLPRLEHHYFYQTRLLGSINCGHGNIIGSKTLKGPFGL
jgi:hypothetical protein